MLFNRVATCSFVIPDQVLVLDSNKCDGNVQYDRMHERFRDIIDYIQTSDIDLLKPAVSEPKIKKPKSLGIAMDRCSQMEFCISSIEKLMKIDESCYHFYCLVLNLGASINLTNLRVNEKNHFCPFNCVLASANSIETIIDIIKTNHPIIMNINEDDQFEWNYENSAIELTEYNILIVFNILLNSRFAIDANESFDMSEMSDFGMVKHSMDVFNELSNETKDSWLLKSPGGGAGKIVSIEGNVSENYDGDGVVDEDDDFMDKNNQSIGESSDGVGAGNSLEDMAGAKVHKMHDFFYVNLCKLAINLLKDSQEEDRFDWSIYTSSWDLKDKLLSSIVG